MRTPNWKLPKCPSTVEQINKCWHIHMLEYPPAVLKMNDLSNNMDKSHKHYAEQKKPDMKEYTLYTSNYMQN